MDKKLIKRLFEASDATNLQLSNAELSELSRLISPSLQATVAQISSSYSSILTNVDFSNLYKGILSQLDVVSSVYFSQISAVQNIAKMAAENHFAALSQIRASVLLSSAFLEQIRGIADLQQTFAAQLAESLFNAIKSDEENERNDNENLKTAIEAIIQSQPDSKSKLRVLTFILTIIGVVFGGGQLYYSYQQNESSRQESADNDKKFQQFMGVLQKIAAKIDSPIEVEEIYYVVERKVNVKIKPNFKAATIVIIYPNQSVRLVKEAHKWIYIEYFDYIDGVPKTGWVNKKYLVKIK